MSVSMIAPTLGATLDSAVRRLVAADIPRRDAELLLAQVLQCVPGRLYSSRDQRLQDAARESFEHLITRRLSGEPTAYLLGHWEFWSLPLRVSPDVLIPRPETELLVEWGLSLLGAKPAPRIADLGTGSGALALAFAHEKPQAQVTAVDLSPAALALAQANGTALGLQNLHWQQADFVEALRGLREQDLIVSNPPYIAEGDAHLPSLHHEPRMALVSGADGLDSLRAIIAHALPALRGGGWLVLEHGHEQGAAVRALLGQAGYSAVETRRDLEGRERASGGCRV